MKFLVDLNKPHYLTLVLRSTDALPSSDKSTFATYMGSNRGGQGCGGQGRGGRGQRGDQKGRGSEQSGRDRGRGLCKCT